VAAGDAAVARRLGMTACAKAEFDDADEVQRKQRQGNPPEQQYRTTTKEMSESANW
jgi:hypothetical protein